MEVKDRSGCHLQTMDMELTKQPENNETFWKKEKLELLERCDNERNEWEKQLKDMQKKIEELYQEVKSRRENNYNNCETINGNERLHSSIWSSSSEPSNPASKMVPVHHNNRESMEVEQILMNATDHNVNSSTEYKTSNPLFINGLTIENLEEVNGCQVVKSPKNEKKCTGVLNGALREIAKLSEEFCSYQDEIRKKSHHQRSPWNTDEMNQKNQMYFCREQQEMPYSSGNTSPPDGLNSITNNSPLVPQRSTSLQVTPTRNLSQHVTDSERNEDNKSKEQSGVSLNKTNSPSVKKSEAVSYDIKRVGDREYEHASTSHLRKYKDSACHMTCASSSWPCDVTRFGNSTDNRSCSYIPIQENLSYANTQSPERNLRNLCKSPAGLECPDNLFPVPLTDSNSSRRSVATGTPTHSPIYSFYTETDKGQPAETSATRTAEFKGDLFHNDKCSMVGYRNMLNQTAGENGKQMLIKTDCMKCATENELVGHCLPHSKTSAFSKFVSPRKGSTTSNPGFCSSHMTDEHNQRPGTLLGHPMSEESRPHFEVAEKLSKQHEKSVTTSVQVSSQQSKIQQIKHNSGSAAISSENKFQCTEMLQKEREKANKHSPLIVRRQAMEPTENSKIPEKSQHTLLSAQKRFSRPSRPVNRRLPSRWAGRVPLGQPTQSFSFSFHSEATIV
ncbi:uncharacterized protein KIAA0408-like [Protopterus annectens]|uniref:uncharacterized protein KIAA0408-like n=1 Tax=Protopterus annectens TaxID=7888 RepID=UPI001CFAD301|nr:uncharacterized protein KIAA0408-like [Protopterus annectens]XP_043923493.1 uncharacterized protein KIAA0408-like [Protopterus annectens]